MKSCFFAGTGDSRAPINKFFGFFLLFAVFLLAACEDGPIRSSYRPVLPELPGQWEEILGKAHWRLEWIGPAGTWEEFELAAGYEISGFSPVQEWSTPVLAWPYWPKKNLAPGLMRPAGAIFPWDASGEKLNLSWEGGIRAFFWKELEAAWSSAARSSGTERLPWYFDWPRFRELLESGNIPEAVRLDPWLADWKSIAVKTVQSGFDRRRIVSRPLTEISISGLGGLWTGSSPFAPPVDAPSGGPLRLRAADVPDTWISKEGVLKCAKAGWVLRPW